MARLGRHIGCAATQWYGWGDTLVVRRHIGIGWGDTMANGRHNGRGRGDTMANRYWGDTMARETQWNVTHAPVLRDMRMSSSVPAAYLRLLLLRWRLFLF